MVVGLSVQAAIADGKTVPLNVDFEGLRTAQNKVGLAGGGSTIIISICPDEQIIIPIAIHVSGGRDGLA